MPALYCNYSYCDNRVVATTEKDRHFVKGGVQILPPGIQIQAVNRGKDKDMADHQ